MPWGEECPDIFLADFERWWHKDVADGWNGLTCLLAVAEQAGTDIVPRPFGVRMGEMYDGCALGMNPLAGRPTPPYRFGSSCLSGSKPSTPIR